MAGAAAAPKEIVDFSPSLPFITSYLGLVSRHTFVCFLFNVLNFNRNIYWSFFAHFGSKKLWYLKVTGSYPELCINGLYFAVRARVFNSYHRLQVLVMQRRGKWCNHVISIHQTRLDEVKYRWNYERKVNVQWARKKWEKYAVNLSAVENLLSFFTYIHSLIEKMHWSYRSS